MGLVLLLSLGGAILLCRFILNRLYGSKQNPFILPFPPGPTPKLLIGNLLDIPTAWGWHKFLQWKEQYGAVVYLEALGNGLLILNTIDAVNDLFDKRANIYSDRPSFVMANELIGLGQSMPLLPYGELWRKHRKLTNTALSVSAVTRYHKLQEDVITRYLLSLIQTPSDFIDQLRLTAGRIIMSVTYGLPVNTPDDMYIRDAEHVMGMIAKATVPGAFLVDFIPALKNVPAWFPFASFQRFATEGREGLHNLITRPFMHAKRELENGTARPSFVSQCIQDRDYPPCEAQDSDDDILRWTAGAMYGAGAETTYSTILSMILALSLYPAVQAAAKAEIHKVVGTESLPTIRDRPSLPYVNAVLKEALRWRPALPLGIARLSNQTDTYKGYYIPPRTIVIPNVWAISRDDRSGIPPEVFAPERFLGDCVKMTAIDPFTYAFGFGRRVCPGRYLAENSLFLLASGILATMNISREVDSAGQETPLDPQFSGGLISQPGSFSVRIEPRSEAAIRIIAERAARIDE